MQEIHIFFINKYYESNEIRSYIINGIKTKSLEELNLQGFLVAGARLERTTFGLWAQRATNCSTPQYILKLVCYLCYCGCKYRSIDYNMQMKFHFRIGILNNNLVKHRIIRWMRNEKKLNFFKVKNTVLWKHL